MPEFIPWGKSDATDGKSHHLAHHGRPFPVSGNDSNTLIRWQPLGGYDPLPHARTLGEQLPRWFPLAFEAGGSPLPEAPAFQHLFAGLVSLADWIGSDQRRFEFVGALDDNYIGLAKEGAVEALAGIGLDVARQRAAQTGPATF